MRNRNAPKFPLGARCSILSLDQSRGRSVVSADADVQPTDVQMQSVVVPMTIRRATIRRTIPTAVSRLCIARTIDARPVVVVGSVGLYDALVKAAVPISGWQPLMFETHLARIESSLAGAAARIE